ncbi:MAG: hypothetical protein CML73_02215 [Rhodobiaceae bacterium]|nr:hypothetical protein [Rhodobiaceae bacterium]
MSTIDEKKIIEALSGLKHPQTGQDIISEEILQGITIRDGNVGFLLAVHPDIAEAFEDVRLACEERIRALPGVLSATVVLTAHQSAPSLSSSGSSSKGKPPPDETIPEVFNRIKSVIAVASGKGGVGKSTVAVNLAAALAQMQGEDGQSVKIGLLDADIYGPSLPKLLNVTENPELDETKKIYPIERFSMQTMSIGYMVKEAQAMVWRGPMVQGALLQMLNDVAWPELDILVLDLPPGTGDIQLTIAQKIPVTGALVVTTPQKLAVADVRRSINMFDKTKTPIIGILENMAWMAGPNGERLHPFGTGGGDMIAAETLKPFLGGLPLDPTLQEATDAGQPVVIYAPDSFAAEVFVKLAKTVNAAFKDLTP